MAASSDKEGPISVTARSASAFSRSAVSVVASGARSEIRVGSTNPDLRIDLYVTVPDRSSLRLRTREGEISFSGDFQQVRAETSSGTVVADVPIENLLYKFIWTASQPRYVSEPEIALPMEKNAGKHVIEGSLSVQSSDPASVPKAPSDIEVRTARGIVLLNVDPEEVPSNLIERPLTEAAKAIIRSGDLLLTDAIRRASPKYFGDYAATLPPRRKGPELVPRPPGRVTGVAERVRNVTVQVTDENNRAVAGLKVSDFSVTEGGSEREIVSVESSSAPFNLVLLLDVSGSVVNYVDFIRKAARSFVTTIDGKDRVAIVIFNEDVRKLSGFSTDSSELSDSLDEFDAGGGTAYYDALGFVLSDTLEPLGGERSAIVVLTDGEDNRSFLSLNSLLGSIQESGALVYPLYVPAGVIAQSAATGGSGSPLGAEDPLRERYLALSVSDKAGEEGETLARISGGVYYPISRLSELQRAYDDIVSQLRSAYTITYRSNIGSETGSSPRIRVRSKRPGTFVRLASGSASETH